MKRKKCTLVLSNGDSFRGDLIGAPVSSSGELVFSTGMVGYSEALSDPSYFGQILAFTYPLIGNYGIPALPKTEWPLTKGFESKGVKAAGAILTIDTPETFHWNSYISLDDWLRQDGVPGIVNVDTRHLVHLIRNTPNLRGNIVPEEATGYRDFGYLNDVAREGFFDPGMHEVVRAVSTKARHVLGKGRQRIGLIDLGVKWNIVRQCLDLGFEVEILPWDTPLKSVDCSAWLISNGPGDPNKTDDLKTRIRELLLQDRPILGICLGHQILAMAAGATTRRMQYGHRSHNQPVFEVGTRLGYITSQNHGYEVEIAKLNDEWAPWFLNLNDRSNEGIQHRVKPFYSVQFHPEAAGGPRDTGWIIEHFASKVK